MWSVDWVLLAQVFSNAVGKHLSSDMTSFDPLDDQTGRKNVSIPVNQAHDSSLRVLWSTKCHRLAYSYRTSLSSLSGCEDPVCPSPIAYLSPRARIAIFDVEHPAASPILRYGNGGPLLCLETVLVISYLVEVYLVPLHTWYTLKVEVTIVQWVTTTYAAWGVLRVSAYSSSCLSTVVEGASCCFCSIKLE